MAKVTPERAGVTELVYVQHFFRFFFLFQKQHNQDLIKNLTLKTTLPQVKICLILLNCQLKHRQGRWQQLAQLFLISTSFFFISRSTSQISDNCKVKRERYVIQDATA